MKQIRIIFLNGFVSSITGLIMSGTGVWLSVYITNRAGAEIMGKFQLIMSVCGFGITFAISGVNFATMRLVAQGLGERANASTGKIMAKCFCYAAFFGIASAVGLFALSDFLADKCLRYAEAARCLKLFAISLPSVSILSSISGYFTAVRRVYKDSAVKIAGQLFRLGLTAALLSLLNMNPCFVIMLATVISEFIGAGLSFALYITDRIKHRSGLVAESGKILPIALPMAFSAYLRSGLMTVKNLLVPAGLMKFGLSASAATSAFGLVHGIALPVVLFPSAFLFSFSALSVPELARVHTVTPSIPHSRRITYMISRAIQLTLLFAIASAGFIFFFAGPLAKAVSNNPGVEIYIRILALLIPVMYLDNTVDNMLKGLNEQVSSMRFNIIDSTVCLLMVIFMLPYTGVYGYVLTICTGEILNFAMSLHRLTQIATVKINFVSQIIFPILSISGACLCTRLFFPFSPIWIKAIICIIVYYLLTSAFGAFSKDDRKWLSEVF